jgi:LacI family transcriptional regulator
MKDAHVTLRDVARRARVSIATASRVLAGMKVRDANHRRVLKAAKDLGYVHNEAARALRNVRTMTIGMVFRELTSVIGIELLSTISAQLDAHGYSVFVSTAQGDGERYDRLVRRFLERRVDGLFCVRAQGGGAALERYLAANIPVIALLSKQGGYERLPLIAPSLKAASEQCAARLHALGHRSVLALTAQSRAAAVDRFRAAASAAGLTVEAATFQQGAFDADVTLRQLVEQRSAVSAIVTYQTEATQLLAAADRQSVPVPERFSVVGIRDRAAVITATRQPLSMIEIEPPRMGMLAARQLLDRLEGAAAADQDLRIETGVWVERATTGPAAAAVSGLQRSTRQY